MEEVLWCLDRVNRVERVYSAHCCKEESEEEAQTRYTPRDSTFKLHLQIHSSFSREQKKRKRDIQQRDGPTKGTVRRRYKTTHKQRDSCSVQRRRESSTSTTNRDGTVWCTEPYLYTNINFQQCPSVECIVGVEYNMRNR